jgi:hypothetical protein
MKLFKEKTLKEIKNYVKIIYLFDSVYKTDKKFFKMQKK